MPRSNPTSPASGPVSDAASDAGRPLVYSSTTINGAARNCAHWLDHSAARVPYDRDVFAAGTVAHAILQAVANWQNGNLDDYDTPYVEIAERQIQEILGKGRTYRGHTEPPPPADAAWAGYQIALDYLEENAIPRPALPEVEVKGPVGGFTCAAILDLVFADYDLSTDEVQIVVRDYKSAWPTDSEELDTLQRRLQGLLAWENRAALWSALGQEDEPDALRLEVVNLRTGGVFSRELREPVLGEYVEDWTRQIATTIRGLEAAVREDGTRAANPGPRCMGCPYVLACDAAREYLNQSVGALVDINDLQEIRSDMARVYAVTKAAANALAVQLRQATAEQPIDVPGGSVGYKATSRTVSRTDYPEKVWQKWHSRATSDMLSPDEVVGLLEAAKITGYGLKSIARVLWPGRDKESMDRRARWLGTVTESKPGKEFGSWAR